jgi:uncharacterized protein YecT (DUF1311 family)
MRQLLVFLAFLALLGSRPEVVAKDFAEVNQHEMNAAAEQEAQEADQQLNVIHKKAMAARDHKRKPLLKASQRSPQAA